MVGVLLHEATEVNQTNNTTNTTLTAPQVGLLNDNEQLNTSENHLSVP